MSKDEHSEPSDRMVEERAAEMLHGGDGHGKTADEADTAERAARRILEDSEARMFDPATRDPDDDGVIRRTSTETASRGDS